MNELTVIFYIIFPWTFDKDMMTWYNMVEPRKVITQVDVCKEFLRQYSYNANLTMTHRDLELTKKKEKKSFSYLSSKAEQVRLFIRNLQPTYKQHLRFMSLKIFMMLWNIDMFVQEKSLDKRTQKQSNSGEQANTYFFRHVLSLKISFLFQS